MIHLISPILANVLCHLTYFGKCALPGKTRYKIFVNIADSDEIVNPLYTGGLFHCYILDKSICHFRGVRYILFLMENPVSKHCRP